MAEPNVRCATLSAQSSTGLAGNQVGNESVPLLLVSSE